MKMKKVSGGLRLAAVASMLGGCVAATDPSPGPAPAPTENQGPGAQLEMLPVNGGGGGTGGSSDGTYNSCAGADPNNPATWYCNDQCFHYCALPYHAACSNLTDYRWVCSNDSPGGCTHGCAPLQ